MVVSNAGVDRMQRESVCWNPVVRSQMQIIELPFHYKLVCRARDVAIADRSVRKGAIDPFKVARVFLDSFNFP